MALLQFRLNGLKMVYAIRGDLRVVHACEFLSYGEHMNCATLAISCGRDHAMSKKLNYFNPNFFCILELNFFLIFNF